MQFPRPTGALPQSRWRRFAQSELAFCLGLATVMLASRLIAFDADVIFKLHYIPNHDMGSGAPFFAMNVHAVRTTGDIAWWNPVPYAGHGFPQYYQSFLSPLAPTCGNVVMIAWMQLARALGALGVTMPEYLQYLVVNFGVLPFLTFFFFSLFANRVFRRRSTVALVAAAYTLSGIGLWNSAWFYFQESFTLFLLLATWIGVVQRPTIPRAMALVSAILVQIASINYWTIYNSWFVAIVIGSHAWVYRTRVTQAWRRLRKWMPEHRAATAGLVGMMLAVAVPWLTIVASITHEQAQGQVRPDWYSKQPSTGPVQERAYSKDDAYSRVQETRWFTLELFNPKLERALTAYGIINPIHDARYIGMIFLPLLVLLPLTAWRRRERWLAVSAAGILCVCIAPPYLLAFWKATPGLDRVYHFFYFYTHFWQLLVVFLAGAAFDRLLNSPAAAARRLTPVLIALTGIAAVALLVIGIASDHYPANSYSLEGLTRGGLMLLVTSGLLLQLHLAPKAATRHAYAWVIVAVATADLSRYFFESVRADHNFTRTDLRANVPFPLPDDVVSRLRQPWSPPDPAAGFGGGLAANLPIATELWPDNQFLIPRHLWPVMCRAAETEAPDAAGITKAGAMPLLFYRTAETVPADGVLSADVDFDPGRFYRSLVLHGGPAADAVSSEDHAGPIVVPQEFTRWAYSDFALTVDAPAQGWLLIHQLYDPLWRINIDGKPAAVTRANQFRMAVAIPPGRHNLEMSYRPFARTLYWPACWLLEGSLAILGVIAWRGSRLRLSNVRLGDVSAYAKAA